MVVRKTARIRRENFSREHIRCFIEGQAFIRLEFFGPGDPLYGPNVDLMRESWEAIGKELLRAFIRQNPGFRPWIWWHLDAPEPRRRILRGYDPEYDPDYDLDSWLGRLSFGRYTIGSGGFVTDPTIWETQAAYLDRHGLLTDHERESLGTDFPREEPHGCEYRSDFVKRWAGGN